MTTEQQAKPKINELNKFTIFANAPGAEGRRSRIAWSIRDGNPRITVYTNIPSDNVNYGIISAPMNPETFYAFLELFEKVIHGESDVKYKIECYTSIPDKDGKYTDKTLLSDVIFGKDANGVVWISVVSGNRPKIKFELKISDYHKIFHGNGNVFTESEASALQAMALVKALRATYYQYTNGFRQPGNGTNSVSAKPSAATYSSNNTQDNKAKDIDFEDIQF